VGQNEGEGPTAQAADSIALPDGEVVVSRHRAAPMRIRRGARAISWRRSNSRGGRVRAICTGSRRVFRQRRAATFGGPVRPPDRMDASLIQSRCCCRRGPWWWRQVARLIGMMGPPSGGDLRKLDPATTGQSRPAPPPPHPVLAVVGWASQLHKFFLPAYGGAKTWAGLNGRLDSGNKGSIVAD
jgi:hypothetical protein